MEKNKKIEDLTKKLLTEVGEDPSREGLLKTPHRVAKSWSFLTEGYTKDLDKLVNKAIFHEKYDDMILIKDIEYYSLCEHHLLPFFGRAHVAYIPAQKVVGLSKLARVVEVFAKRLQTQERLTMQIAKTIMHVLQPRGVAVTIDASHQCMTNRGVKKEEATTVTNYFLGAFKDDLSFQNRYLRYINKD